MLRTRVLTGIVLGALVGVALFGFSPAGWTVFSALAIAAGAWEWAGFARCVRPVRTTYAIGVAGGTLAIAFATGIGTGEFRVPALVPVLAAAVLLWVAVVPFWLRLRPRVPSRALVLVLGAWALIPAFLALVQLRNLSPTVLLMVMAVVWISDSAAYFTGHHYGRNKLAPSVSPGKTWEGVAGAFVATTLYALALRLLVPETALPPVAGGARGLLVLVWAITALGIVGDLFESALKRSAGLKDSGTLLPGHGGVLDRVDALLPILPLAALALVS